MSQATVLAELSYLADRVQYHLQNGDTHYADIVDAKARDLAAAVDNGELFVAPATEEDFQ